MKDVDSVYGGTLICNSVRWLSRGSVIDRRIERMNEIKLFWEEIKATLSAGKRPAVIPKSRPNSYKLMCHVRVCYFPSERRSIS